MGRLTLTVILALTSAAAAAAAAAAPPVCSMTHATIWAPKVLSLAGHIGLQAVAHGVAGNGTQGCRPWHIGLQAWEPKDLSFAGPIPLMVARCLRNVRVRIRVRVRVRIRVRVRVREALDGSEVPGGGG